MPDHRKLEVHVNGHWCEVETPLTARDDLSNDQLLDQLFAQHYVVVDHAQLGKISVHPRSFAARVCDV